MTINPWNFHAWREMCDVPGCTRWAWKRHDGKYYCRFHFDETFSFEPRIQRYLRGVGHPVSERAILNRFKNHRRKTIFTAINELLDLRLIENEKGLYQLTPAGMDDIARRDILHVEALHEFDQESKIKYRSRIFQEAYSRGFVYYSDNSKESEIISDDPKWDEFLIELSQRLEESDRDANKRNAYTMARLDYTTCGVPANRMIGSMKPCTLEPFCKDCGWYSWMREHSIVPEWMKWESEKEYFEMKSLCTLPDEFADDMGNENENKDPIPSVFGC